MKTFFKFIWDQVVWFLGILMVLLLPFWMPFIWIKSLFSDDIPDHKKVGITKEFVIYFFSLAILVAFLIIFKL